MRRELREVLGEPGPVFVAERAEAGATGNDDGRG
jgi:hypothetical protein